MSTKEKNNSRKRIEATEEHVKFSIRDLSEKGYIFVIFNRNFIQKINKKKKPAFTHMVYFTHMETLGS